MNTALAPSRNVVIADIEKRLSDREEQFRKLLGETAPRFIRIAMTAIMASEHLPKCAPLSLYQELLKAAQDGLVVDGRQAALVPRYHKKQGMWLAHYQPMVRGLIDGIYASGEVSFVDAHAVHANDAFEFELGDNPHLLHRPAIGDRGAAIAYYCIVNLKDGGRLREVMWREPDIERHRKRSATPDEGPWKTDYDAMALKTVIRKISKLCPMGDSNAINLLGRHDDITIPLPAVEGKRGRPIGSKNRAPAALPAAVEGSGAPAGGVPTEHAASPPAGTAEPLDEGEGYPDAAYDEGGPAGAPEPEQERVPAEAKPDPNDDAVHRRLPGWRSNPDYHAGREAFERGDMKCNDAQIAADKGPRGRLAYWNLGWADALATAQPA